VRIRWAHDDDELAAYSDPLQWHFDHPIPDVEYEDPWKDDPEGRERVRQLLKERKELPAEVVDKLVSLRKILKESLREVEAAHEGLRGLCGRRGCAARLATSEIGETRARLHSGLLFDEEGSIYRMSTRASEQWKRARLQSKRWEEFSPTARHPRKKKQGKSDRKLDRMLQLEAVLPANVECPVCGAVNLIPPPPLRLDET